MIGRTILHYRILEEIGPGGPALACAAARLNAAGGQASDDDSTRRAGRRRILLRGSRDS